MRFGVKPPARMLSRPAIPVGTAALAAVSFMVPWNYFLTRRYLTKRRAAPEAAGTGISRSRNSTGLSCRFDRNSPVLGRREFCRRDQHAKLLAPHHDAAVLGHVHAGGHVVVLATLERPQPAEVDEHGLGHVGGRQYLGFRHQVDVVFRPRPDFEIRLEVQ